jgi:transcriptional regulator with GAF, ATPase, and Fis domain
MLNAGSLWIYSMAADEANVAGLVSQLKAAGLAAELKLHGEPSGPGILLTSRINRETCEWLRAVSRNGAERVLVVTTGPEDFAGDIWRALTAGASEVIAWSRSPSAGAQVAARFQRWQEVDEVVASPLVRNHLVGESQVWKTAIRGLVEAARYSDSPILLAGETGTGKELAARLIHTLDLRRNKAEIVVLDCTTIVPELSGSELFGHERGAFTGAFTARDGAFALARDGTLFLDEIGDLPLALQVQLLRVLQERTFKRVGSNTWQTTDFRLVCATNRDLVQEESSGRFRRDLYHRIAALRITMPPLRDRVQDIVPLARHFMREARPSGPALEIDEPVKTHLLTRSYPGNVRDLRNLVYRFMARHVGDGPITVGDIAIDDRPDTALEPDDWCADSVESAIRQAFAVGLGLREIRRAVEETAIRIALEDEDGNLQRAALRLSVTDRALQKRRAENRRQLDELGGAA